MKGFLSYSDSEQTSLVEQAGGMPYHTASIRHWILQRGIYDFSQMTDLSNSVRSALQTICTPLETVLDKSVQAADGTTKLLLRLHDKEYIETVHIPGKKGYTICVSTQVGCPVGCRFCASGMAGLVRNLQAHEIIEQFLHARPLGKIARAVVMGIGEPTLNMDNLVQALSVITHPQLFGLGARRVTISTVGYPERIRKLAKTGKPYNLAVSLHAPDDLLRQQLIPSMKKYPLDEIILAANDYFAATGREVTFEYVLLGGINDQPEHAQLLSKKLMGTRSLVNAIPYNPVPGSVYQRPEQKVVDTFQSILQRAKIPVTIRWSKGLEADAACGQLRIGAK